MPRDKRTGGGARPRTDWEQVIVDQLRTGRVLPIVGNRVHDERVLGGHEAVAARFAERIDYPRDDCQDLPRVALFDSVRRDVARAETVVKRDYLNLIKNLVCDQAEEQGIPLDEVEDRFDDLDFSDLAGQLGRPAFGEPGGDPLLILADLDLPIYLTTSYHRFIELALEAAGKRPRTGLCRWRQELETWVDPLDDEDYQPSRDKPLVYHLHGLDSLPESLVLTEDDYMGYLVKIASEPELIPLRVKQALTQSSLMLLGYDLREYDFRSLLWGLIKPRPVSQQSVCVLQVSPGDDERHYLDRYLNEVDFKISWGSFDDYARRLYAQIRT